MQRMWGNCGTQAGELRRSCTGCHPKDTGVVRVAKHPARRRTRRAVGIHLYHLLVGDAEEGSDDADFGRTYIHDRMPATIREKAVQSVPRDVVREDVKGFD